MESLHNVTCVDDDRDILTIVELSLRDIAGLGVQTFDSGCELLHSVASLKTDLILMDMMMPKYTGLDTLRRLRHGTTGSNLPVIFMTAKAQKHEVQEYMDAGAVSVIVKPFNPLTLGEQLRELWIDCGLGEGTGH